MIAVNLNICIFSNLAGLCGIGANNIVWVATSHEQKEPPRPVPRPLPAPAAATAAAFGMG
jgi:hypothetical protein